LPAQFALEDDLRRLGQTGAGGGRDRAGTQDTERLKAILLGYLTDAIYDRVQIVCGASSLERRIRRLACGLAGEDLFEVSCSAME
jgi:hypothetical protein